MGNSYWCPISINCTSIISSGSLSETHDHFVSIYTNGSVIISITFIITAFAHYLDCYLRKHLLSIVLVEAFFHHLAVVSWDSPRSLSCDRYFASCFSVARCNPSMQNAQPSSVAVLVSRFRCVSHPTQVCLLHQYNDRISRFKVMINKTSMVKKYDEVTCLNNFHGAAELLSTK